MTSHVKGPVVWVVDFGWPLMPDRPSHQSSEAGQLGQRPAADDGGRGKPEVTAGVIELKRRKD